MRFVVVLLLGMACIFGVPPLSAQELPKRFDVPANPQNYPQSTPQECLASVLKAIDQREINYLLAHLADPQFVDTRVKELGGKFDEMVRETRAKLSDDPTAVKELRRFLRDKEAVWNASDDAANANLKDVKNRAVFFRKVNDRWFLENRKQASTEPK